MLTCLIWLVIAIVIAGVLVWAIDALPLDATIKSVGRVIIIVMFVILVLVAMMNCLGLLHMSGWPAVRP